MSGWGKRVNPAADGGKHQCDVYRCFERACVDYGRHFDSGILRDCRYACCKHARGLKGHLDVHPEYVSAS